MAVLTAAGITFSDTTSLNSKYGIIDQNRIMTFLQSAAPTGWTQIATDNDKAFRVVSGTGAGSGGSISFSSAFPNVGARPITGTFGVAISGAATGGTTLEIGNLAPHTHGNGANSSATRRGPSPAVGTVTRATPGGSTGGAGWGSGSHAHPFSLSASGSFSSSLDLRVAYADAIICSFN